MSLSQQEHERLTEILQVLGAELDGLNDRSREFVSQQIERHKQYGDDVRLSPKQWSWLESLYEQHAKLPEPKSNDAPEMDDEIPF